MTARAARSRHHIHGFLAGAPVQSFVAPMHCSSCGAEFDLLFNTADFASGLPAVACPTCRQPAELDELEAQYLLFLHERAT